ncbi:hypothetical protein DSM21852_37680 [Methylocystis bryophila]|nr:hypothetical protein DSM21852_37680 [Methylocystis bryophila]
MIRRFVRIVTLLLVGTFCFALGVYTGPTEPVVQVREALEEQVASALQSLRAQTEKAKIRLIEATRRAQPAATTSSAPPPAPTAAENAAKGTQAEDANPGTVDSSESPTAHIAPPVASPPPAPSAAPAPSPQGVERPSANIGPSR